MENNPPLPPEKTSNFNDQSVKPNDSNDLVERSDGPGHDPAEQEKSISLDEGHDRDPNDEAYDNPKEEDSRGEGEGIESGNADDHHQPGFEEALEGIDRLISDLSSTTAEGSNPVEIPGAVDIFARLVQSKIDNYNSGAALFGRDPDQDSLFVDSLGRIAKLVSLLGEISDQGSRAAQYLSKTSLVLQRAMSFMEDELRVLLEDSIGILSCNVSEPKSPKSSSSRHSLSNESSDHQQNTSVDAEAKSTDEDNFPGITDETISSMKRIASSMISAGYETECCQVYNILRRDAFKEAMERQGFEKISIDEVQKMQWEPLEGHIASWVKVVKYSSKVLFPGEKKLCDSVFTDYPSVGQGIITNLARAVIVLFLTFAEAISMTKRSAERLFKVLYIYETLTELMSVFNDPLYSKDCADEIRSEISAVRRRLGEAAVCLFCDLENSIKSYVARNPVPSGAVHPLTRYTMNYLRYACDFKDALEQVFSQNQRSDSSKEYMEPQVEKGSPQSSKGDNNDKSNQQAITVSPFSAQLMSVMDLLDANLEAKSKLYKDPSLRYIFLMNNGRYILQKIKESTEVHALLGDNWRRRRSSELRAYHKNYQRETWSKVLQCLSHEGLQVHGKVHKPILKERFKSFNQMFDEIHKTQSTWVVSDEQLQSELRVSISAVMIPAYRSFVARFGQYFTPGRQAEKYIKYQPEDIETVIEELFDGNAASMARRKN
ncbi:hypothetical protein Dimus_031845 [Dionaea muscipula]